MHRSCIALASTGKISGNFDSRKNGICTEGNEGNEGRAAVWLHTVSRSEYQERLCYLRFLLCKIFFFSGNFDSRKNGICTEGNESRAAVWLHTVSRSEFQERLCHLRFLLCKIFFFSGNFDSRKNG